MDKNILKTILLEQKQEMNALLKNSSLIKREKELTDFFQSPLIKVIMGVRRCGKSVLAGQALAERSFGYINFEDERLIGIKTDDLNDILETILFLEEKRPDFLFFDEIQNVAGWELFANRLQRQGYNIIITGSNAKLLSRELATHLTGRHTSIEIFPFSFGEFLARKKISWGKNDFFLTEKKVILKKELDAYMQFGGFPEIFNVPEKEKYLSELYQKILARDIMSRYSVRYTAALKELALYIFSNISSRYSYHKLKNIFEIKSVHTVKNYLAYLEEAYLVFQIDSFSWKAKERLRGPKKIYAIDPAMAKAVSSGHSYDEGHALENMVFIELKRQEKEIYYFTDYPGHEVDFVVKNGQKVEQLVQVCISLFDQETKKRELRSLLKAAEICRCDNLLAITKDEEGEEKIKGKTVKIIPAWKWFLEKN